LLPPLTGDQQDWIFDQVPPACTKTPQEQQNMLELLELALSAPVQELREDCRRFETKFSLAMTRKQQAVVRSPEVFAHLDCLNLHACPPRIRPVPASA